MTFYVCSLPQHGPGEPKELFTDDPALVERFIEAEDKRPGRGVFQCINPLLPGARRRSLETVAHLRFIYFDLDLQNIEAGRDDVIKRLRGLPVEFIWVRDSGFGNLHVGIEIKDAPARDTPEYARVVAVWKRLAEKLAADPAPVHPAALIRCVGTHNKKNGGSGLCHMLWNGGGPLDITELEELDDLLAEPLLARKPRPAGEPRAGTGERKAPIDVAARLAAMTFGGPGDSAIHMTQLSVTASLLRSGVALEEATHIVLDATRAAVADDPQWDWRQEELTILRMGCDFIVKKPELTTLLPDKWREPFKVALEQGRRPDVGLNDSGFYFRAWKTKAGGAGKQSETTAEASAGRKYRFPLIAFDDMRPGTEPNYLVDELFPAAGLALVYGAPKSGKSFWVFDAVMHVALGWEYRDRAVQQGPVIYCAFEGAHGYRKRSEAFRRHHCLTDERPPLFIVPGRADLIRDHASLIGDMQGQLRDIGVAQLPKAVVLDTLNKSLTGSESKDVDMANCIAAAEAIQKVFGCLVIIVHHHGIEESRPRGHTSLRGAVDAQIKITRDEQNNIIAEIEDMRDGPEGAQIASRLVVVEVGADLTGKHITSAAVEPVDAPLARQKLPRLTPNQRTMLSLLEEAGPFGLSINEWNSRARAAGLGKHRAATLADLRADLRRKGLVIERGGAWLVASNRNRVIFEANATVTYVAGGLGRYVRTGTIGTRNRT
jgi:hypothetical protein